MYLASRIEILKPHNTIPLPQTALDRLSRPGSTAQPHFQTTIQSRILVASGWIESIETRRPSWVSSSSSLISHIPHHHHPALHLAPSSPSPPRRAPAPLAPRDHHGQEERKEVQEERQEDHECRRQAGPSGQVRGPRPRGRRRRRRYRYWSQHGPPPAPDQEAGSDPGSNPPDMVDDLAELLEPVNIQEAPIGQDLNGTSHGAVDLGGNGVK